MSAQAIKESTLAPAAVNGASAQPVQQAQQAQPTPVGIAGNGQSTIASAQPALSPEKEAMLSNLERSMKAKKASGDPQQIAEVEAVADASLFLLQKLNPSLILEQRGRLLSYNELSPAAQAAYAKMDPTFVPPLSFVPFARYDGLEGDALSEAIGQDLGTMMLADKARNPHLYGAGHGKIEGTDKKDSKQA